MLNEFLKEAVSLVIGKPSEVIVDFLDKEKYVNEFIIAKKLDNTINQTRNLLYKLSEYGMVSSMRKKDKKKGWYTYFWKIEVLKVLEFLKEAVEKKIKQTEQQIDSRESKRFYICERCNIELNEENALLHDFTCNECGSVLSLKDNTKVLKELKKNLEKQKKERESVEKEINNEKEKIGKKKAKENKKEEREKEKKKLEKKIARREEREKEKKKLERENPKKIIKKKAKAGEKSSKTKTKKKTSPKKIKKVAKKKSAKTGKKKKR